MRGSREDEWRGLRLDSEELAASAWRVWKSVMGEKAPREGDDPPAGWERVGQHAEMLLGGMEGKPYSEAAFQVMVLFLGRDRRPEAPAIWGQMPPAARLAWEAAARHLTMLLNSEEIMSVTEAESPWPEWARGRAARRNPEG